MHSWCLTWIEPCHPRWIALCEQVSAWLWSVLFIKNLDCGPWCSGESLDQGFLKIIETVNYLPDCRIFLQTDYHALKVSIHHRNSGTSCIYSEFRRSNLSILDIT